MVHIEYPSLQGCMICMIKAYQWIYQKIHEIVSLQQAETKGSPSKVEITFLILSMGSLVLDSVEQGDPCVGMMAEFHER